MEHTNDSLDRGPFFPRNKSIITIRRITGTKRIQLLKPVGSQTTFTSPQHWMQPNGEPNLAKRNWARKNLFG